MTLQQALKVSDLVVCNRHPNLVYFLWGGHLYCRSLSEECRSDMSLVEILTTDWMPYIEPKTKEPCAHEPLRFKGELVFESSDPQGPLLESKEGEFLQEFCKCGKRLRAEKWVVV